uniref:Large ribosomal subunit protein uL2 n=1 Tax=Malurus cyaneus samueli TaxID=2593467 RepID=A0A8C5TEJ7_9PASS
MARRPRPRSRRRRAAPPGISYRPARPVPPCPRHRRCALAAPSGVLLVGRSPGARPRCRACPPVAAAAGWPLGAALHNTRPLWKCGQVDRPLPCPAGRLRVRGIGGGHKRRYRMIDFQRLRYEEGAPPEPFTEKVINVRYDPCRSADIALVAGGNRKRWIIATENMQPGDSITNSPHIGRMAVSANEGDAYPLGALPCRHADLQPVKSPPGKGAQYYSSSSTCGVLLRKVNGTAIVQLPSKRQMQVLETCVATVGRVSNVDHNKRVIGKAGRNRWLGKRPHTGLWHRKGGWAGRKIRPLPPMKSYVNLPRVKAMD